MHRLLALLGAAAAACGSRGESARGAVGGAVGAAIAVGVDATAQERAPWRCAALDEPAPPAASLVLGPVTWTIEGRVLRRPAAAAGAGAKAAKGHPVRIAFVADAEASTPATLAVLAALRHRLATPGVDAIVSLGGMGGSADELTAVLGALADGTVPVIAIPGDREPVAGHRAAVAGLAARGVVDGSAVRWLVVDGVGVATLPGQPAATRLAAGVEGCGHNDADAGAVLGAVPDGVSVTILASQRAPRHGDGGDRGALGSPGGEAGLATAARGVDLIVHGALDGVPSRPGARAPGDGPVAIATGIATASPRLDAAGRRVTPSIVVVSVEGNRVMWQLITP